MTYDQFLHCQKHIQEEIERIRSDTIELMCTRNDIDSFFLGIQGADLIGKMEGQLREVNTMIVKLELNRIWEDK